MQRLLPIGQFYLTENRKVAGREIGSEGDERERRGREKHGVHIPDTWHDLTSWLADSIYLIYDDDVEVTEVTMLLPGILSLLEVGSVMCVHFKHLST